MVNKGVDSARGTSNGVRGSMESQCGYPTVVVSVTQKQRVLQGVPITFS